MKEKTAAKPAQTPAGRTAERRIDAKPKPPQPPNHTDVELDPELSAIADHPWVVAQRDDREETGLWGIRKHLHDPGALTKIMTLALVNPTMPGDLGELVMDYLRARNALPEMIPKSEGERLYLCHLEYAWTTYRGAAMELAHLGADPAEIAALALYLADIEELDPDFVAEVEHKIAELAEDVKGAEQDYPARKPQ